MRFTTFLSILAVTFTVASASPLTPEASLEGGSLDSRVFIPPTPDSFFQTFSNLFGATQAGDYISFRLVNSVAGEWCVPPPSSLLFW